MVSESDKEAPAQAAVRSWVQPYHIAALERCIADQRTAGEILRTPDDPYNGLMHHEDADVLDELLAALRDMLASPEAPAHCPECKRTDGNVCDWCPSMVAPNAPAQASQPTQGDAPSFTRELLMRALSRMDRARNILTDGTPSPICNWGMLSTEDLRYELAHHPATNEAEQAGDREAINYEPLHAFAEANHVSYNELCTAVRAALQRTEQREPWQPIETAPISGRGERPHWFLTWNGHHIGVCARWGDEGYGETIADETDQVVSPPATHWMTLPAAPGITKKEG